MAVIPNPKKEKWVGMLKGAFLGDIFESWNIDLEKNKGRLMLSDRVIIQVDSTTEKIVSSGVAFDAASNGGFTGGSSTTWTHTCSGLNRKLIVFVVTNGTSVGVTYNGVSMTLAVQPGSTSFMFYLDSPAVGSHTVSVSTSGGTVTGGCSSSYTGCTTGIDNFTSGTAGTASSISLSLTPNTVNDWIVMGSYSGTASEVVVSNNANTTIRSSNSNAAYGLGLGDTNAAINPIASTTLSMKNSNSSSSGWTAGIVSIAPTTTTAALGFDVPLNFVFANLDGNRLWVLSDNLILKTAPFVFLPFTFTVDILANSPTDGVDMLYYTSNPENGRLLVTRSLAADIAKLSGTDIAGSGWNLTWKATSGFPGPLALLSNLVIVGVGNTITTIDNNDILVSNRLIFNSEYSCNILYAGSDVVWMGWISTIFNDVNYSEGDFEGLVYIKGAISFWDGGSETMNESYFIDSAPLSGFIVNDIPYFILQNGQIVTYSSVGFVEIQAFPNFEEGISLGHLSIKRHGCVVDGTLVYINITAPLYSKRMRSGIWIFDTITKNLYNYAGIGSYALSTTIGFDAIGSQNVTASGPSVSLTVNVSNGYGVFFATNDTASAHNLSQSNSNMVPRQGSATHFLYGDSASSSIIPGSHTLSASAFGSTDTNAVGFWITPSFGKSVTYDNSNSTGDLSGTPVNGTLNLTIANQQNNVCFVAAMAGGTNADTASQPTVTLAGVSMNLYATYPSSNNAGIIWLFYTYNAPAGTQPIAWAQGSTKSSHFCVIAASYYGVSMFGPDQDFGQQITGESGALLLTKDIKNRLLIGSNIFTSYSGFTEKNVIATLTIGLNSRGYFVTPLIQTNQIEEYWYNMWLKYPAFYNSGNMISAKWRTQPELLNQYFHPLQATITWTGITTFTAVLPVGVLVGHEVEIMNGDNAGATYHILTLSAPADGTTSITVTIDESTPYLSSLTSLARFDNWNKIKGTDIIPNQSGQSSALQGGNSVTSQSPYVQFKIELRGVNMGVDQLVTDEKTQTSTNL